MFKYSATTCLRNVCRPDVPPGGIFYFIYLFLFYLFLFVCLFVCLFVVIRKWCLKYLL